jgi:glutathione synthase/RimK-type ligase-like ATP-grasp enzyme
VASTEQTLLDSFVERLGGFPVVLKVPGGEGGLGVMRVDGMVTLVSLVDYLVRAQGHVPLLSAYIPDAVHHRVIVVGDQAVASYENPIRDGDFRSIPSLEPEAYSGTVAPALGQIAVAATRAERLAFAGVDLIVHPTGRVYVLEVNYPCYFAQATLGGGIDVAGRMVDYLVARALQLVGSPA